MSDANAGSGRLRWGALRSRRLRHEDIVGPVIAEPKVWENAGELLAQEFKPLPGETTFRLR